MINHIVSLPLQSEVGLGTLFIHRDNLINAVSDLIPLFAQNKAQLIVSYQTPDQDFYFNKTWKLYSQTRGLVQQIG